MSDLNEQNKFNAMLEAVAGGDSTAINKLMEDEGELNKETDVKTPATEEVIEPLAPVPAVEETATEGVNDDKEAQPVVTDPAVAIKEDTKADDHEATKAELEKLRSEVHRYKSDAGRIPFTQKRMQELEREVATLKASQAAKTGASASGDVELDDETKAVIEELRVTDPVMAKAMETLAKKAFATATTKVTDAFNEYSKTAQEADDERYFAEQYSLLTNQIPQAPQIFASNEWKQWKRGLTPNRLAMAESVHAEEVATAIYAFAADMQRLNPQPAAVTTPAEVSTPVVNEEAKRAIEERARKVQNAAEVTTPAARNSEEFDAEKAYIETYNRLAKANHIG